MLQAAIAGLGLLASAAETVAALIMALVALSVAVGVVIEHIRMLGGRK